MARVRSDSKPNPIPVLYMVRELGSGGIERDVTKLAIGLDRLRFTPHVATFHCEGLRYDDLKKADVSMVHLPVSSLMSPKVFSVVSQFRSFVREKKIQVVHAFDASGVFGIPLARLLRVPAILTSALGHRELLDRKTLRQVAFIDRLSDAVVVNCKAMRKHLMEDFSIPSDRIELCYNGVDTTEFYPAAAPKTPALADASIVIGTVCVLRPEKSLDVLQEAFAKICHLIPGSKLLIVGDGPEREKLQANSLRSGIHDASVFLPAVSSVAPLMRAMHIFVSSSRSEAFSNSILEAMACGCCVIGSRVGGTPELITDEESGLLFSPGDANELAEKLLYLVQNPPVRKRLGAAATEFATQKLNIQIAIARTMEIYTTILERKHVLG
jgi:glycosyltransferase involved in cell wall biosynthesis